MNIEIIGVGRRAEGTIIIDAFVKQKYIFLFASCKKQEGSCFLRISQGGGRAKVLLAEWSRRKLRRRGAARSQWYKCGMGTVGSMQLFPLTRLSRFAVYDRRQLEARLNGIVIEEKLSPGSLARATRF